MVNIAVLISGGGTNLQALLDAEAAGKIPRGKIALVVSSKADAYGLVRAANHGVPTAVAERRAYPDCAAFEAAIQAALAAHQIDLVILAGFLSILSPAFTEVWRGRIVNVHPSLLPAFGGDGMYGLKVHEAVLASGVPVTGATVHHVNEVIDGGDIILQKSVAVQAGDTPEILQRRVMEEAEWRILPEAVAQLCLLWDDKQKAPGVLPSASKSTKGEVTNI
ncbi:MAG TPA: phosphoribosylglycinamide formyltransferase [Clostridiales bacterium]|nr:phosphoribosylglycinamide formyltransferase [Clostridiales bacterium]